MRIACLLPVSLLAASFALSGCGGLDVGSLFGTPTITSVTPNPATRSTQITITGTNLSATSTVAYFTPTTGTSAITVNASGGSTTTALVVVPSSLTPGTYNLYVTTPGSSGVQTAPSNTVSLGVN